MAKAPLSKAHKERKRDGFNAELSVCPHHVQHSENIRGDVLMAMVVHHLSVHHHQHFHIELAAMLVLHEDGSFVPWNELVLIRKDEDVVFWRFGHV